MATGLPFLDTGAMYRCVALVAIRKGVQASDSDSVADIARSIHIDVRDGITLLDGNDVSGDIRTPEVNSVVSIIATNSAVREVMREAQRRWARSVGGGVVEGRDIGTVVFPDATLKVFLTASPEVRAQRRVAESGGDVADVARSIAERDHIDSTRADSPLRPAPGAAVVDSSDRPIEEVVGEIVRLLADRTGGTDRV
ncbi:MAG: cytidylate kinase [Actinomycetota bacterium]